ncbi:MAG: thioredoxin [Myxococcaceae bacterium]|nr:thioredoxin [Myxococcaceae bacterium]
MGKNVSEVTDSEFKAKVLDSPVPVLVDFTATWCPPCRAIKPSLEELAAQYQGKAAVVAVDVDVSQATSQQFGIRAMPTLLMFKGGKVVNQLVGAAPKAKLEELITKAL